MSCPSCSYHGGWLTTSGEWIPCAPTEATEAMRNLRFVFTPAQLAAAREAWSAALRAKQEEARERDRRQIVCDDDRWEVG